jgi:nucleoside-diphosphate-sugar epimerase
MNVTIAGGHGQIALHLTSILGEHGHHVRGLIRNPDHSGQVHAAGGEPVLCDLESATAAEVADALGEEVDTVVFAARAGPGSGATRKETVDHEGAVKLLDAATARGVAHYVMVSAMNASADHEGDEVFDAYLRAKGRADDAVRRGSVPATIVAPTTLTNDEPTGRVTLGDTASGEPISRRDVAAVLAEVIEQRAGLGRTLQLTAGETPIADAVAALESSA